MNLQSLHSNAEALAKVGKTKPGLSVQTISRPQERTANLFMVHRQDVSVSEFGFMKIPTNDLAWAMDQKPAVIRLFHECWLCDPYGNRWMQLNTILKSTAFGEAKKRLIDQGLFVFKRETSIRDGRSTVCWLVQNLHGSRASAFWEAAPTANKAATTANNAAPTANKAATTANNAAPTANKAATTASISPQIQSESAFQNAPRSSQDFFKIFSLSLSQAERENFEKFIREEWRKNTTKPGQTGEEIISMERFLAKEEDCRNWYTLFLQSPAGKEAKKQAIAAKYDWRNDPRFEKWIWKAWNEGWTWAQADEVEQKERNAFLEWAQNTNAYEGVCY